MNQEDLKKAITEWHRFVGRRGGQARTDQKRAAARINAEKARQARADKRKKGEGK